MKRRNSLAWSVVSLICLGFVTAVMFVVALIHPFRRSLVLLLVLAAIWFGDALYVYLARRGAAQDPLAMKKG